MTNRDDDRVVIATTFHAEEALAWRDRLQSTGIDAGLSPDIDHVEMLPGEPMSDEFELSVPAGQEQEAREELEEIMKDMDKPSSEE